MNEEIERTIKKLEELGWITVNEHLNREALVAVFIDILKEMPLKKYLDIFTPKF